MPPPIAAVLCLLFIGYLYWDEFRTPERQRISWAPFVWMFFAGSRFPSYWVNLGGPVTYRSYDEGSPFDRAVFFALIIWGATVLARRSINWGRLLSDNKLLTLYLLYCLSSLFWTDQPFVLAKRWVKDLGNPIMALVLLTEHKPWEAVGATVKRLSYIWLPLSVLFIKYYPNLGRGYTPNGSPMFTGVGNQKNDLGLACFVVGMYMVWKFLQQPRDTRLFVGRTAGTLVLAVSLAWLLHMSNSQTSIACLAVATGVLLVARIPRVASRPSRIVPVLAAAVVVYAALQAAFDVNQYVLDLMGRDETLTNRTSVWEVVRKQAGNPLVGTGFMSFWSAARTLAVREDLGAFLNQAHNGYLEQYLNLGYIGVAFVIAIMLLALVRIRHHLDRDAHPALLRLCIVICSALYNYTEASFYGINNMWLLLLAASIRIEGAMGPTRAVRIASEHVGKGLTRRVAVRGRQKSITVARSDSATEPVGSRQVTDSGRGRGVFRGSLHHAGRF